MLETDGLFTNPKQDLAMRHAGVVYRGHGGESVPGAALENVKTGNYLGYLRCLARE